MSLQYPDKVRITPIIRDESFRTETEGKITEIRAQVERENRVTYDSNGQPVDPRTFIMLPPEVEISKGDKVEIIELHGVVIIDPFEYHAISVFPVGGGVKISHFEVEV